jgi:hypothetical protein
MADTGLSIYLERGGIMHKFIILIGLILVVGTISCSDDENPVVESGPLFSITVLDAQGNPDGPLRVGIINHPIDGIPGAVGSFPKPCPAINISFSLPEAADYALSIFDYNDFLVKTYSGHAEAGMYEIFWEGDDDDGQPVPSGFYKYRLEAGSFEDERWAVLEKGPDPHQTIIGGLNRSGIFTTDNLALLPGLIDPQPIEYFTDTVTIHLSRPDFPDDFFYYTTRLTRVGNSFSFILDSLGLPDPASGQ